MIRAHGYSDDSVVVDVVTPAGELIKTKQVGCYAAGRATVVITAPEVEGDDGTDPVPERQLRLTFTHRASWSVEVYAPDAPWPARTPGPWPVSLTWDDEVRSFGVQVDCPIEVQVTVRVDRPEDAHVWNAS